MYKVWRPAVPLYKRNGVPVIGGDLLHWQTFSRKRLLKLPNIANAQTAFTSLSAIYTV